MMDWLNYALLYLFAIVSLALIGIVLIQRGKGGGLASAFGGGSGTATAFGSKTGDILTWATSIIFGVFLLLAIFLNLIANRQTTAALVVPAAATPAMPAPAAMPGAMDSTALPSALPGSPAAVPTTRP